MAANALAAPPTPAHLTFTWRTWSVPLQCLAGLERKSYGDPQSRSATQKAADWVPSTNPAKRAAAAQT